MKLHRVLNKYLLRKKLSSPGFSLRSLASELKVSAPFLSRVMKGEKPIPYELLLKLGPILEIEAEVFTGLKVAHQQSRGVSAQTSTKKLPEVKVESALDDWDLANQENFKCLRQWFYLAILEFTTLKSYDGSAESVAERLGLSAATTGVAMRELASLGFLIEENGRFVKTKKKIRWGSSKPVDDIRKFHDQMLGKAQALLRAPANPAEFERRLITGITLTTSQAKIEEGRRKLSEFLHELAAELIDDQATEVYQLSAQLFPLTKPE